MSGDADNYLEHRPGRGLADFVECYWTSRADTPATTRVLPDGCSDLIFDRTRPNAPWFVGTMKQARLFTAGAARDLVAIRFHPGGARALLGVPAHELVDSVAPLTELTSWCPSTWDVEAVQPLAGINTFLRARMAHVTRRDRDAARLAMAVFCASEVRVQETADRLGVSRQHLRRRVLDATGIGPKHLTRVGRLRRTAEQIRGGAQPDAQLAAHHGYFDQAHLAREFRSLAQISPTGYQNEVC